MVFIASLVAAASYFLAIGAFKFHYHFMNPLSSKHYHLQSASHIWIETKRHHNSNIRHYRPLFLSSSDANFIDSANGFGTGSGDGDNVRSIFSEANIKTAKEVMNDNIKMEIRNFLLTCLESTYNNKNQLAVDPNLLTENAYILSKGKLYEQVIGDLLTGQAPPSNDDSNDVTENDDDYDDIDINSAESLRILRKIDSFLSGFISSERKARSRLKLNYMLAGASSNRLENAIDLLYESDEIDDALINFIDSLMNKQLVLTGGPAASLDDDSNDNDDDSSSSKATMDVLRMLKRRLLAQLKPLDTKVEIKLLSILLNEKDRNIQEKTIRERLNRIELLEQFNFFLDNGIDHLIKRESGDDRGINNNNNNDNNNNNNNNNNRVELKADTIARMRGLKIMIDEIITILKTGFKDNSVFEMINDEQ